MIRITFVTLKLKKVNSASARKTNVRQISRPKIMFVVVYL